MFKFNKITAYFYLIISTEACHKTEMSSLQTSPARIAGPPSQGWLIPDLSCSVVHYSIPASLQTNRKQIIPPLQCCPDVPAKYSAMVLLQKGNYYAFIYLMHVIFNKTITGFLFYFL